MCTVSVKVDEAVIREVHPELVSTAAIRRWAQMLIDAHIRDLIEDSATVDLETAREMVLKAVREEYARPS